MLATIYSGVVPGDTPVPEHDEDAPARRGPVPDRSRIPPNSGFVLERVKDFDLPGVPAAKVDKITVKIVRFVARGAGRAARQARLHAGPAAAGHAARGALRARRPLREQPTAGISYFFMNSSVPPFDKLDVRRAVNLGIAEDALARVFGGLLEPTCNFLPPDIPGYEKLRSLSIRRTREEHGHRPRQALGAASRGGGSRRQGLGAASRIPARRS